MIDRVARKTPLLSQVLLILMGLLIVYLLVDFGRQVNLSRQRREELQQLEQKIVAAQEEQARLEQELDYVRSDQAAEEWARENGQARPGEVPVVVVAPPAGAASQVEEEPGTGPVPGSPREAWWDLFFGTR